MLRLTWIVFPPKQIYNVLYISIRVSDSLDHVRTYMYVATLYNECRFRLLTSVEWTAVLLACHHFTLEKEAESLGM